MDILERYVDNYLKETIEVAKTMPKDQIKKSVELLAEIRKAGGLLFILGVGGSAANASHAVNDFRKIGGIETYAPTDNVAELTARTNDEGWDTSFTEWLKISQLSEKDAIMVLSVGGGNETTSQNIVKALRLAKDRRAKIISIVSRNGGESKRLSDACVLIPVVSEERITPHAEGWQGVVWHLMVNALLELNR